MSQIIEASITYYRAQREERNKKKKHLLQRVIMNPPLKHVITFSTVVLWCSMTSTLYNTTGKKNMLLFFVDQKYRDESIIREWFTCLYSCKC